MSAQYDITADYLIKSGFRPIHAGDDYDHFFTVERPPGTALSLALAKIWFTIKEDAVDSDAEAKLQYTTDSADEIEITAPATGAFTIHLAAADTENLAGTWQYDVQVKLSTAKIITIARGFIEFLPHITYARS
jgi:hypothetical protein